MHDPRCWREVFLRTGVIAISVAIAYFVLGSDPWVWWIPLGVGLLVLLKWTLAPRGGGADVEADELDAVELVDHID